MSENAILRSTVALNNSRHWQEVSLSDGYTAQSIFDQVWEAPYEWFQLAGQRSSQLPCWVLDVIDNVPETSYRITAQLIVESALRVWLDIVSIQVKAPTLADWLQDLDAKDVDCILQYACFNEIRYS